MKDHDVTAQTFTTKQRDFFRANPDSWLMIRPDRPSDKPAHQYPNEEARQKGNAAMKLWFEYLAAKGFVETFNSWWGLLKAGQSIMVVCPNPHTFDLGFVPPSRQLLAPDFWDEFERSRILVDRRYENYQGRGVAIIKDCAASLGMQQGNVAK